MHLNKDYICMYILHHANNLRNTQKVYFALINAEKFAIYANENKFHEIFLTKSIYSSFLYRENFKSQQFKNECNNNGIDTSYLP